MSRAKKDLATFIDLDLPDLRSLNYNVGRAAIKEITAASSVEEAIALLEHHLGFDHPSQRIVQKYTRIGFVSIPRDNLAHIVEKRRDARERYVLMALDTLYEPFEIWETLYDDEIKRYIFIGVYQQKKQMLVIVAPWDGKVLWNFMHCEAKGLNKHRQGNLLYLSNRRSAYKKVSLQKVDAQKSRSSVNGGFLT